MSAAGKQRGGSHNEHMYCDVPGWSRDDLTGLHAAECSDIYTHLAEKPSVYSGREAEGHINR